MALYGLDDSQRVLRGKNKTNKILKEYGLLGAHVIVHCLCSMDKVWYIWTLGYPNSSHGKIIASFLTTHCSDDIDEVVACNHYDMYPDVAELPFLILVEDIRRNSRCGRESKKMYEVYNRAHNEANIILNAIFEAFMNGSPKEINMYRKCYFGDWPF